MKTDRIAEFHTRLTGELLAGMSHYYGPDNWDRDRFGPCPGGVPTILREGLSRFFALLLRQISPVRSSWVRARFESVSPYLADYAGTYSLLEDEYSRSLFVRLVAFRMLGYHHVKLPLAENSNDICLMKKNLLALIDDKEAKTRTPQNVPLNVFDLHATGYPIRCYSHLNLILPVFLLKQYEYRHDPALIAPREGDYVIDGGGGWGDSALTFAHAVGPQGMVFSFEFEPDNLAILEKNFLLNPELAERIGVIHRALWDRTGEILQYAANGVGTSILPQTDRRNTLHNREVITVSIDDFVRDRKPARIDFIKMDIEGAELRALQGAAQTVGKFRPGLAITIYHSPGDFAGFPVKIHQLFPDYAFFLDHFTMHAEETILFAVPREKLAHPAGTG